MQNDSFDFTYSEPVKSVEGRKMKEDIRVRENV